MIITCVIPEAFDQIFTEHCTTKLPSSGTLFAVTANDDVLLDGGVSLFLGPDPLIHPLWTLTFLPVPAGTRSCTRSHAAAHFTPVRNDPSSSTSLMAKIIFFTSALLGTVLGTKTPESGANSPPACDYEISSGNAHPSPPPPQFRYFIDGSAVDTLNPLTISPGETICWYLHGHHNVIQTVGDSCVAVPILEADFGEINMVQDDPPYQHTFTFSGTFYYACTAGISDSHCGNGMRHAIQVVAGKGKSNGPSTSEVATSSTTTVSMLIVAQVVTIVVVAVALLVIVRHKSARAPDFEVAVELEHDGPEDTDTTPDSLRPHTAPNDQLVVSAAV